MTIIVVILRPISNGRGSSDGLLTRGPGSSGLSSVRDRNIVVIIRIFFSGFRGREIFTRVDGWIRTILYILAQESLQEG